MVEPLVANGTDYCSDEPESKDDMKEVKRPMLPKQESLVLYTRAALSPEKMIKGSRKGRKPRPLFLTKNDVSGSTKGQRRPLLKQQSEISTGSYHFENNGCTHPEIVISSGSVDQLSDDSDGGLRTPLPVLPVVPPEVDTGDENEADTEDNISQLPDFLFVTQRYRRSSLVRMDALKQPGATGGQEDDESCRRISVHGSLDLKRKDLSEFRNAVSFSAAEQKNEDDTVTISEIRALGGSNMLKIPDDIFGKHKGKGPKRKRPSLRRLLTVASEPKLNRQELEERHACRKKEREERRKERRERKLQEKQKMEEEMYDEDGVSIA